ncbi:MAG: PEP-CTERM sorting domain-containing protein [Gammaproteobacteria bacterium]|nr:PEP-CTERM sorting domain-containing protein [Gammaproteobacteria bacterium]
MATLFLFCLAPIANAGLIFEIRQNTSNLAEIGVRGTGLNFALPDDTYYLSFRGVWTPPTTIDNKMPFLAGDLVLGPSMGVDEIYLKQDNAMNILFFEDPYTGVTTDISGQLNVEHDGIGAWNVHPYTYEVWACGGNDTHPSTSCSDTASTVVGTYRYVREFGSGEVPEPATLTLLGLGLGLAGIGWRRRKAA